MVGQGDPWALPDLVVIDGGQGQLSAAIKGMARANVAPYSAGQGNGEVQMEVKIDRIESGNEPLILEEAAARTSVPIVALAKQNEEVFVHNQKGPVNDSPDSAALLLLRSLRDESHRFALTAHRKRRSAMSGL